MNMLKKFFVITALIITSTVFCLETNARVSFLPGTGSQPRSAANQGVRRSNGNQCSGFSLRQKKCEGMACSAGWDCQSCSNAQGQFWKCTPKKCSGDFKAGKTSCGDCEQYSYDGFAGNQICGLCTAIANCTTTPSSNSFSYVNRVKINGANIEKINKTGYRN